VSGALTATGKPILANDPHRVIAEPSLRYIVHLVAPGWNVIGAGEPALPGVAAGHNEHTIRVKYTRHGPVLWEDVDEVTTDVLELKP